MCGASNETVETARPLCACLDRLKTLLLLHIPAQSNRRCSSCTSTSALWLSSCACSVALNAQVQVTHSCMSAKPSLANVHVSGLAICSLSRGNALFFSGLMSSLSSIVSATSLCSTLPKARGTNAFAQGDASSMAFECSSVVIAKCAE